MSSDRDSPRERELALASRILHGDAVDLAAERGIDPQVRYGLELFQKIFAAGVRTEDGSATPLQSDPPPRHESTLQGEAGFIGQFRVVRKLGEGGMGVVYEAEQQQPRRLVALKVVRGGQHVDEHALKLFQREIQTLARLIHPRIAQLYESGVTDDGMHFFAMELVRGVPLSEWLTKRPAGPVTPAELTIRLALFGRICEGVAYAHQKGVIHRDLKPGNIRVSGADGPVPEIKILDFGLAHMTDVDVQRTTFVTEMGKVRGTLPYMSPEQIRGNTDEIDLRADVYSLGVILYELVTGRLPLDVSKAQLPEAMRIICEEPPRSLNTTFTGSRRLDADVVTIAGKCLEKEPRGRYQSAAALGEDIQRYLADQPIMARRPSASYQFRKLVRRHKGPFAAAAGAFVLLAAFGLAMSVQAARIARERDRANKEAETAKQVSDFLESLFKVADPTESRGNTITAREILDKGALRIERELKDQPFAQARLLTVMGRTYLDLSDLERAESLMRQSMEINAKLLGSESLAFGLSRADLGWVQFARGQPAEAGATAKAALKILTRLLPELDPRLVKTLYLTGATDILSGDISSARKTDIEVLRRLDLTKQPDETLRVWCLNDLGMCALSAKDYAEAHRYIEKCLRVRERVYPAGHPERLVGLTDMAYVLMLEGDLPRARTILESLLPQVERTYGPGHTQFAYVLCSLGEVSRRQDHLGEAESLFERSLAAFERAGIGKTTGAVAPLVGLARIRHAQGRLAEAEKSYRETIDILTRSHGQDTPEQIEIAEDLGRLLQSQGRLEEASSLRRRIDELRARSGGEGFELMTPRVTSRVE